MKIKVILVIIVNALLILCCTTTNSAIEIPQLKDYITDDVGVLIYSEYYERTYWTCQVLDEETSCELLILVIESTQELEISQYSIEVFNSNGVGNKEKNNGVLIVVATIDGK